MKIGRPCTEVSYWDECNKNLYPWYKKGKCKKILRKRWIKKKTKHLDA